VVRPAQTARLDAKQRVVVADVRQGKVTRHEPAGFFEDERCGRQSAGTVTPVTLPATKRGSR
jgi:hypothetical protein